MAAPFRYNPSTGRYSYDPTGANALRCQRVATVSTSQVLEEAKPSASDRAVQALAEASRAAVESARAATEPFGGWLKWAVIGVVGILGLQVLATTRTLVGAR